MNQEIISLISKETRLKPKAIEAVIQLLEEGSTIAFIARYRKEVTGSLDEVQIITIRDSYSRLQELDKRRQAIIKSLEERQLITQELSMAIKKASTLNELEDIYLPYRPKKRTRGTIAREAGLEPLAQWLLNQANGALWEKPLSQGQQPGLSSKALEKQAEDFLNVEAKIKEKEDALAGARDILAEHFNENAQLRQGLRKIFTEKGLMSSKAARGKKDDPQAQRYRDYFEWSEMAHRAPSHRILAILRGSNEGYLSHHFLPDEEEAVFWLQQQVLGKNSPSSNSAAEQVLLALQEGYKRLTSTSLETEYQKTLKERADHEAIKVFADNVRELLMASPLGQKRILALDPGLRTGCKLVCLGNQGELLHHGVIYPLPPKSQEAESAALLLKLCREYRIEALAVGNGTGGRETEEFLRKGLKSMDLPVIMVNESGASIYSASQAARDEFPNQDITVRGAVSIGRRLMDPLAELVKIDAQSIGVGQYQHDVDQKALSQSLDDVVRSCVNAVGVELNTASKQLLSHVSGISPRIAGAICLHRQKTGPFKSRVELKKVSGLGPKVFEQSAGFLRISGASNPLDSSAVHPESYPVVKQMAQDLGSNIPTLMDQAELRKRIEIQNYVSETVGLPTLKDIIIELEKPGRDPREAFELFQFSEAVHEMDDLEEGMILPGKVTNVTAFGAFVDIGVHQDGLVHISQLADRFVQDPADVVKVNQNVQVKVMEVDIKRRRIGLSMKAVEQN
ncbi:MAG: Tex family protein [Spirochaetaceae bacterium]|jgi:uncharacterized protein|nr:Tex family protein [Spirochaetaceae bacterium]